MNKTLELINIKRIELKQIKSSLYRLIIYTNNQDNCYVYDRIERREKDSKIERNDLFDSMTATSIITIETIAIKVIDAAKIIKEYIDNINHKNERINAIANSRKKMLKIAIGVIFDKKVDD